MAKDIDLTSREWLNLVFEGKNKEYGAYELRESSSDRHIKALVIVTMVGLIFIYLPRLVKSVVPQQTKVEQFGNVVISAISEPEVPEKTQVPDVEIVPPPSLEVKKAIQFTPPVVKPDDLVDQKKLMATQLDLTTEPGVISNITTDGVLIGGIDPAEVHTITQIIDEPAGPTIHVAPQIKCTWPDGNLMKWLSENLVYPAIAIEKGIEGRVILRFVVAPDGSVSNVEILRSLDPSCDKEAVRVVKKMPKWIPGKNNGEAVYSYFTLPILFKLQK
jgi:protein TonB